MFHCSYVLVFSQKISPSMFIPTSLVINSGTFAPLCLYQAPWLREMRVLILELLSIFPNSIMLSKDLQLQNWYSIIEQALRSVQLIQKPPIHLFLLHSFLGLKWVSVLKESEKKSTEILTLELGLTISELVSAAFLCSQSKIQIFSRGHKNLKKNPLCFDAT